jgi:hypothetical protein
MNDTATIEQESTLRGKVFDYLSLERNVSIASAAVFILGLGEELWKKFLPKYLEALGPTTAVIGLFGTAQDFSTPFTSTLVNGWQIVSVAEWHF